MRKTSLKVAFVLVFAAVLVFNPSIFKAEAQSAEGVSVKPVLVGEDKKFNPGDTFSDVLWVTNVSSEDKMFYISARDISGIDQSGGPIFSAAAEKTGLELSSWVNLPVTSVVVKANETKEIPFSIKIPANANPGGHFGGIFFNVTPDKMKTIGSAIGYEVGTLINLTVAGNIVEEAQIREFSTDKNVYSRPTVGFKVKVENLGNVLIRPRGPLDITDSFGKKVGSLVMNDQNGGVFPKSTRTFEAKWEGNGLMLGRYQAVIGLVYGTEGMKTISQVVSFWIVPMDMILLVLGVIILLILVIVFSVKFYIKRKLREMGLASAGKAAPAGDVKESFAPFSKLAIIAITLIVLIFAFLLALFLLFA
jgi:hypothetical protein